MKTILMLNDTTDHDNWGSIAGAEALKAIISETCPGVRIESIPSAWATRKYRRMSPKLGGGVYWGKHVIRDMFSGPFPFAPSVADEYEVTADDWLKGGGGVATAELMDKLRSADAVVFQAEGATYRTNSSAIRCLFALWLARTRFGIPALFLNGSVTLTVVDPVLPAMVKKTFGAIDGVAVREPFSLRSLEEWVPEVEAKLVPDSVFFWPRPEPDAEVPPKVQDVLDEVGDAPFFCLSLSMLASMQEGYMRFGARGSALHEVVEKLQKLGLKAVVMARDYMDQEIIRGLADCSDAVYVGPGFHYREIQALLSRARFLVSGRYHHLIMATISGCPCIPLRTSSHKVNGLSELVGEGMGEVFDPTDLFSCSDAMAERAAVILADNAIRRGLMDRADVLHEQCMELGHMVRRALQGRDS